MAELLLQEHPLSRRPKARYNGAGKVHYLHNPEKLKGRRHMSGDDKSTHIVTPPTPSFAEMTAALKSLQAAPEAGLGKHISTIIVASIIGLGFFVVSGVSDMKNSMTEVKTTLEQSGKTLSAVQNDLRTISESQQDMRASQAKLEQRVEALERTRRFTP